MTPGKDDDVIPLSRFTALPARARGKKRLDAILAAARPGEVVAALPVQDLFFLIQEVGLDDAHELVELATPEQVQGLLDLGGWDHDRVDLAAARPWLEALIAAGEERLTHVFRQLDPEWTALLFKRWTRIYNLAEEEVPDDEEPPFVPTPDRFFVVKITAEDPAEIHLIEQLIDRLYRVDAELARHVLRAASSEPFADLEEMCFRWRSGRMQDLGYAAYEEALEAYRPLDPAKIVIGEGTADRPALPATLPQLVAGPAMAQPFLARVLAQVVDGAEARRLEAALVGLVNRVLAADRVEPGDREQAAVGAARAAATLSIGLETVARGDVARGVDALASVALVRLHRAGVAVLAQLRRLLELLGARAHRAEEPALSLVAALREPRPAFPRALDQPPAAGTRPFASLADVQRATQALAELALEVRFVHEFLGADPAALGPAVTLGDVARTAVVHVALGRAPSAKRLLPDEVSREALGLALAPGLAARFPPEYLPVVLGCIRDIEAGRTLLLE